MMSKMMRGDTGASAHMTFDPCKLHTLSTYDGLEKIIVMLRILGAHTILPTVEVLTALLLWPMRCKLWLLLLLLLLWTILHQVIDFPHS